MLLSNNIKSSLDSLTNYKQPEPFRNTIVEIKKSQPDSNIINVAIIDNTKGSNINRNNILNHINEQLITTRTIPQSIPIIKPKQRIVIKVKKNNISHPIINNDIEPETDIIEPEIDIVEPEKDIVEPEEIIIKKPKKITIQKRNKYKQTTQDDNVQGVDLANSIIRTQIVSDRLPKSNKLKVKGQLVEVKTPVYYMENRKLYVQQVNEIFKPYEDDILAQVDTLNCNTRSSNVDFNLLTHQHVVKEYLNLYSPYRGLLLYHGLGSGKTCTSIAIAEGMKSNKQIILMTPASLKQNFFNEMKICGDSLYKKNQFWEFIPIEGNPEYVNILAKSLSLSTEYIRQQKGAWLVNINKPSNYVDMDTNNKESIDSQINEMIRSKYIDINYNGLNDNIINSLTENSTKNPFDNSVVIIDEAHNFISMIVNKLKSKDSISYKLYEYLMNAVNARIVLLSGTPIINQPNEIGVLFNILRGYITSWTIPIKLEGNAKLNTETILKILDNAKIKTFDYVNVSGNELTITKNPYGFINTKKKGVLKGTQKQNPVISNNKTVKIPKKVLGGGSELLERYDGVKLDDTGNISNEQFLIKVINALTNKTNNLNVIQKNIVEHKYTALPVVPSEFMQLFVDTETKISLTDKNTNYFKNIELFQRRILGLTSYFRSALEKLLPRIETTETGNTYHIEYTEMSKMQFNTYVEIRKSEVEREKKINKMKHRNVNAAEVYKISSSYRIYSRAACNFVFPSHIKRPTSHKLIQDADTDEDIDNNEKTELLMNNQDSDIPFNEQINSTFDLLTDAPSMENPDVKINYLLKENLTKYCSPKFARILENITNETHEGLHLVYSAFRTLEGIGILRRILIENGFAEFKIIHQNNEWIIQENPTDINKPKFVLHTGTESIEEKEIILNVYNGKWDFVPSSISSILRERADSNIMGNIIKVLMITASGAEGINLLNTRYVHIVEPYWHMVRLDQVVGRARRICSHTALDPVELQTVKVFLYISKLNISLNDSSNLELINRDVSKIDDKTPIATDETLYENSLIKQKINDEFLNAIQQTAVDCELYKSTDPENTHKCYNLGLIRSNDFLSYPDIEQDKHIKLDLNMKITKDSISEFTHNNKTFLLNNNTYQIYDLNNKIVGQMIKHGNSRKIEWKK
jgi:hypothetical protein